MAKFQKGDKVRITAFKHGEERHCKGGFNVGDIITITIVYARTLLPNYYEVAETDDYFFFEDELEPVKDDTCSHNCDTCTCHHDTVTINTDIPLNDKKEAHRVVHAIVEKVYKDAATAKAKPQNAPWTEYEIEFARDLVSNWAYDVIHDGGDLYWHIQPEGGLEVVVYKSLKADSNLYGYAAPHHSDEYNVWIGKCVSLAKALGKPIPDFIKNKKYGGLTHACAPPFPRCSRLREIYLHT